MQLKDYKTRLIVLGLSVPIGTWIAIGLMDIPWLDVLVGFVIASVLIFVFMTIVGEK